MVETDRTTGHERLSSQRFAGKLVGRVSEVGGLLLKFFNVNTGIKLILPKSVSHIHSIYRKIRI